MSIVCPHTVPVPRKSTGQAEDSSRVGRTRGKGSTAASAKFCCSFGVSVPMAQVSP